MWGGEAGPNPVAQGRKGIWPGLAQSGPTGLGDLASGEDGSIVIASPPPDFLTQGGPP